MVQRFSYFGTSKTGKVVDGSCENLSQRGRGIEKEKLSSNGVLKEDQC